MCQNFLPFSDQMLFHYIYLLYFLYPCTYWWTLGLFSYLAIVNLLLFGSSNPTFFWLKYLVEERKDSRWTIMDSFYLIHPVGHCCPEYLHAVFHSILPTTWWSRGVPNGIIQKMELRELRACSRSQTIHPRKWGGRRGDSTKPSDTLIFNFRPSSISEVTHYYYRAL